MNTVTVKINGMEYNLKGKENQEYLLDLAGYVDGKVREIMNKNSKLSSTAVAVLA
ncbi:MAG: cell division protein ZapA, partial [Clostridium sp.]